MSSAATTTAASAPSTSAGNNNSNNHLSASSSASNSAAVPSTHKPPPASNNDNLSPSQLRTKLDQVRKELRTRLDKKRKVDRELANLEASIYGFEGSYLSDNLFNSAASNSNNAGQAAHFGNIIKGYDAYLKAPSTSTTTQSERKRQNQRNQDEIKQGDRMFSMSSATYQKAVEITGGVIAVPAGMPNGGDTGGNSEDEDGNTTGRKRRR